MSWMLVSDSTCEIHTLAQIAPDTRFSTVPLKIRIGEREFVDNCALDVHEMMQEFANSADPGTTACPSPEEWAEQYLQADKVLAFTITHTLSGSYSSACAARDIVLEEHPEKKIAVIDTLSCGGEIAMMIEHANKLIAEGRSFEDVVVGVEAYGKECHLLFMLASFDNLVRNGRMNPLVGFLAGRLGMRALGCASEEGKLTMVGKSRGETRMLAMILEEMDKNGFMGQHPVLISHNCNENAAHLLRHGILAKWPGTEVRIYPCGGLCAYYEQDQGMIIGY